MSQRTAPSPDAGRRRGPRPWHHTIFIPLIWFFSLLFAVPTVFFSDVRHFKDDFYVNSISARGENAMVRKN